MRFFAVTAIVAVTSLVAAGPAAAQLTAPPKEPVAHIFKFTPKTVGTSGITPQPMMRIDQAGAKSFKVRLVLTPAKRNGKVKKIIVNLGTVPAGEVAIPLWPASKKLSTGKYKVRLTATADDGSTLTRPDGSRGVTTLNVVQSVATASSSVPGLAGAMLGLAQQEIGVTESPKGSNDSPRIAIYRAATTGGKIGPWCAYFISWLARTSGAPIGDSGQGYGRVDDLFAWAQRVGKAIPAIGVPIQPGDLMVWDEHIGIVESINPDGSYTTIDGNYGDTVTRRVLTPERRAPVVGYVRL